MNVAGRPQRTIWPDPLGDAVLVIDQRHLPHAWQVLRLADVAAVRDAIADMVVRGAPLIGVTAAYGLALQARHDASDAALEAAALHLKNARPTAVNLAWAVDRLVAHLAAVPPEQRAAEAWGEAGRMADADVACNEAIGLHGLVLLRERWAARQAAGASVLNVLTHCNAGWLATVDWGTALAPVYRAHDDGIPLHVWVDETRPRNQGAALTAWELSQHGVPHTVVADNAGGHLMQRGLVDVVIVGTDRTTARGDVCNKIGTYLKALAAKAHGVPFLVALPWSTLDLSVHDGVAGIPIEERPAREVTHLSGRSADGLVVEVQLVPDGTPAANPAFDVTPAALVTALITEHGVVAAEPGAIAALAARVAGAAQISPAGQGAARHGPAGPGAAP